MATGLGVFGLSPADFWMLTPKEFEAAHRGRFGTDAGSGSLDRAGLEALMEMFPDFRDDGNV